MRTISIDIETYSPVDLRISGVHKYAAHPEFEILLFGYSIDGGPVKVIDLASGERFPSEVLQALSFPEVIKKAWNAAFERTCIAQYLKREYDWQDSCPAKQWRCTMIHAANAGLPLSLEAAAKVLKVAEKDPVGKALIKFFCVPCKPSLKNGGRTRNLPHHEPHKWENFIEYCRQDVVVEMQISDKLNGFDLPEKEHRLWALDQKINDTGILIDPQMVSNAITMDATYRARLDEEATGLTGLANTNSTAQIKSWITEQTGTEVETLRKGDIPGLMESTDNDEVKRMLEIRQEMSKTSIKKYEAMLACCGEDNRVRGLLQFYGANRTGRWAGRLIQVQNLPQNHIEDLDLARQLVQAGDVDVMDMLYESVPSVLSQLIRTAFIAPEGHRFIVADFSAIEARVIAWLANEKWRLDVFKTHGKIYEASASQMFKVPIEAVTKGSALRQKGKVSELALGYQGGPNALIAMGALSMGLLEEELPALVAMWRRANPAIVRLWDSVNDAAVEALENGVAEIKFLKFNYHRGSLLITLPSGRKLSYLGAKLEPGKFGGSQVVYMGMDQTTKQWGRQHTYGGKLVENIVQAIARDCLAEALLRIDEAEYTIVMHVHDEVVIQEPDGTNAITWINALMGAEIKWAPGLPLTADSYETKYYKKD